MHSTVVQVVDMEKWSSDQDHCVTSFPLYVTTFRAQLITCSTRLRTNLLSTGCTSSGLLCCCSWYELRGYCSRKSSKDRWFHVVPLDLRWYNKWFQGFYSIYRSGTAPLFILFLLIFHRPGPAKRRVRCFVTPNSHLPATLFVVLYIVRIGYPPTWPLRRLVWLLLLHITF